MKSRIITNEPTTPEIDWYVPQIVNSEGLIVVTTGRQDEQTFEGIVLVDASDEPSYTALMGRRDWRKECFTPCKLPLTITFEND